MPFMGSPIEHITGTIPHVIGDPISLSRVHVTANDLESYIECIETAC